MAAEVCGGRHPPQPGQRRFKGQFAEAVFDTVDSSGCIKTVVTVIAYNNHSKQTGQPEATSRGELDLFQVDHCAGRLRLSAFGLATLTSAQFHIDQHLNAARLHATIQVTDVVSRKTFPVDVSVRWTGSGDTVRDKHSVHLKEPGFQRIARFIGTVRSATASGSVSDGTSNFTPLPASVADMGSVKQGEVVITHQ